MSVVWWYLCALAPWIVTAINLPEQLDEDQECPLPQGGLGVCQRISRCPSVLATIRIESPVRCGFLGFEEIVCCPHRGSQPTEKKRTTERVNRQQPSGLRRSQQACQRFKEAEVKRLGYHILNGEEAQVGEFPHMAAVGFLDEGKPRITWRCGGSLISERFVLTAAHCTAYRKIGIPRMVRLGQNDINAVSSEGTDYPVERIFVHPNYKKKVNYDDIALLLLSRSVKFSEIVSPACLYSKNEDPNKELVVTGWGATESSGLSPSVRLLKTTVSVYSYDSCRKVYKRNSWLPDGLRREMICAKDPNSSSDTCQGDSGGPLQLQEDNRSSVYTIFGVTSFGPSPCGGAKPGVYTRVSSYLDWIESIVW